MECLCWCGFDYEIIPKPDVFVLRVRLIWHKVNCLFYHSLWVLQSTNNCAVVTLLFHVITNQLEHLYCKKGNKESSTLRGTMAVLERLKKKKGALFELP